MLRVISHAYVSFVAKRALIVKSTPAQCICYDVRFSRMILNREVVVLQQLQPSPPAHIQLLLSENIA
ncbi:hypothetical protein Syun_022569 [Stephania yunnanensis]|uniref:Uncharacterized protein n=1 Tax=Stephania yunnanensis TaxID=152371 RepID=A0AAP0HYN4_9MAGN